MQLPSPPINSSAQAARLGGKTIAQCANLFPTKQLQGRQKKTPSCPEYCKWFNLQVHFPRPIGHTFARSRKVPKLET
jgi:hypothetical protein